MPPLPRIATPSEWATLRALLLLKEKALTKELDLLAAERRKLPMVPFDGEKYTFFDEEGKEVKLVDLFGGKSQVCWGFWRFPAKLCF